MIFIIFKDQREDFLNVFKGKPYGYIIWYGQNVSRPNNDFKPCFSLDQIRYIGHLESI